MDATLKRRTRKVAIVHFCLTAFVIWESFHQWAKPAKGAIEIAANDMWHNYWENVFSIFQPQVWAGSHSAQIIRGWIGPEAIKQHLLLANLVWWVFLAILAISIPFWSAFVGWLYTKLVDRLNHFPTLGRKYF